MISNHVICATNKGSDQPARSLIRDFASRLNILCILSYWEFQRSKGGCIGSFESTLVKIPHCWKSQVRMSAQVRMSSRRGQGGVNSIKVDSKTNAPMALSWTQFGPTNYQDIYHDSYMIVCLDHKRDSVLST